MQSIGFFFFLLAPCKTVRSQLKSLMVRRRARASAGVSTNVMRDLHVHVHVPGTPGVPYFGLKPMMLVTGENFYLSARRVPSDGDGPGNNRGYWVLSGSSVERFVCHFVWVVIHQHYNHVHDIVHDIVYDIALC